MAIPRNLGNLAPGVDTNGVLGVTKGGTGATSNAAAPFALKGANADITSLTGLSTALSVAQGGTGRATLTSNNVILGNGTSQVGLVAPGTNGNVLVSNGTTWTSAAPVSSSAMTLISSINSTSGTTVEFKQLSGYANYLLIINNLTVSAVTTLDIQYGTGGATPTYLTSGYNSCYIRGQNGSPDGNVSNGSSSAMLFNVIGGGGDYSGFTYFTGFTNTTGFIGSTGTISGAEFSRNCIMTTSRAVGGSAITAIKFSGSTFSRGTFSLYGISS
jgi:hypothetical protein